MTLFNIIVRTSQIMDSCSSNVWVACSYILFVKSINDNLLAQSMMKD